MASFTLTPSQQTALESFKTFLSGPTQVFMLKGAAGTGKTTLVKAFLKTLFEEKQHVALMAPTGRAAYILHQKTQFPASTIHRAIYQNKNLKFFSQHKEDEDDGSLFARFGLKPNEDTIHTVYIVDEASLISDTYSENEAFLFGSGYLLQDLFEFVRGRKVVFVGDYAQLPPVGMNFSPALDADYLRQKYGCEVIEVMLREVVRQQTQSGILRNATQVRDCIEAKNFIEFQLAAAEDFHSETVDLLQPYFQLSPDKPNVKAAVVAYSNKQVLQYNQRIRQHYFGEQSQRLLPGELLMVARNNYANEIELFNGNIVQVTACQDDAEVERRLVRVKLGVGKIESVELWFRAVSIIFHSEQTVERLNIVILDNFLDAPSPTVGGLLARALIVDFNNRLPQHIKEQLPAIRRALRAGGKLSPGQRDLYESYMGLLCRDKYYNALICKYGYALTCHKAQGGEWDNVFVDMGRYGGTANEDYFRWVYTALTRASKQLWHFRAPEFTYISQLFVETIQKSAHIDVSVYTPKGEDFCAIRFRRIQQLAQEQGLTVSEDKSRAYQHWVTFTDGGVHQVTFTLWYKARGYSGKVVCQGVASDDFALLCMGILEKSAMPGEIPFSTPNRPFAQKLHGQILSVLDELGIQLLDVTQEQYHDTYHLKTDGWAKVEMWYNDKGSYTYMKPISSLGTEDEKLNQFRSKFM
jgi:hypothetical protein